MRKKRTLFVDDQENVLQGLKRVLRSMRGEWEFAFVQSGKEALEVMEKEPFDVIICEELLPKMSGLDVLTEVMKRHPEAIRIILTGYTAEEMALKSFYPAHQVLTKPCSSENLKALLHRTCALRDLMKNDFLKSMVSKMGSLPSVPTLYQELMEELGSEDASVNRVGEIISQDVGMTAKILQLVNSAVYGFRTRISTPQQAVGLMGLETISSLVLSVQVFSQFRVTFLEGFSVNRLWEHSMSTANMAKGIALAENLDKGAVEDCFMAGLLHDCGKLVLAAKQTEAFTRALRISREKRWPLYKAELEVFGTTHAEVGAYLMGLWGLPDPIVEALAFHHFPGTCACETFSPLTTTHIADFMENEGLVDAEENRVDHLDTDYLRKIGVEDKVDGWRDECLQQVLQEQ